MKKSKIVASVLLCTILVSSIFAGCGGSAPASSAAPTASSESAAPADPAAPADEPVTLTMLLGNTVNQAGLTAVFEKMQQDIGISIETEMRPGGAEGENIVRARLASGDSPDIHVFNSGSLLQTLNPVQNFIDLTNQPFMDRVMDSFEQSVTVDGKVFGIPVASTNTGAWIYNKAAYAELGLEVPHTWAQLMDNCEKIKAAGKTAIIGSFADDWTSQLILLSDFYNVQAGDPNFAENFDSNKDKYATNQYAFKAFEHMQEVWDRGFFNADYNATTYDQALQMLTSGDGVHYPMLTHALGNAATNLGVDAANGLGCFGQPGDDPNNHGLTVWMPDTFYFYSGSEKADAMMKFAEYYLSPESVTLHSQNQAADGPYVVEGATLPDDALSPVKDLLPYFDSGKTAPALEFITSVKGPNSPQICIQVYGGMVDAATGAQEYDLDVEKQAKQLALPGW